MALPRGGVRPLVQVADPVVGAEAAAIVVRQLPGGAVRGGRPAPGAPVPAAAAATAATGTTVAVGEVTRSATTSRVARRAGGAVRRGDLVVGGADREVRPQAPRAPARVRVVGAAAMRTAPYPCVLVTSSSPGAQAAASRAPADTPSDTLRTQAARDASTPRNAAARRSRARRDQAADLGAV